METLICAATWGELRTFGAIPAEEELRGGAARLEQDYFLLTGVGIPCALAAVLNAVQTLRPVRILNLGIAGAYPGSHLGVGDIVIGESEVYGDVGFELPDPPHFQPVCEAPFGEFYRSPFPLAPWPTGRGAAARGRGCTVNSCAGTEATGHRRKALFQASFETMEGAAVAQAGVLLGVPVSEVRAISNIAARRDMRPENIRLALNRLTSFFEHLRE